MQIPENVQVVVERARERGQTVVLVTGVFDLLHHEHERFLRQARAAGDVLIVAIESDARVRQLKGAGRPVQDQWQRQRQLARLSFVDEVMILPDHFDKPEHHLHLLQALKPDILAVSSHTPHLDKKQQLMALIEGRVEVVYQHQPAVSTTQLLQQSSSKG